MINLDKTHQFADIIHDTIPYSGLEGAIISTPIFNRLHRILQSSLVGSTFSSNKVKRFEHSIGVMHLAGEMFYRSFNNIDDENLYKSVLEECNNEILNWINHVDFSKEKILKERYVDKYNGEKIFNAPIPNSSLYREKLPHFVTENYKFGYLVLFESVRIAALLHDVGHLPYSHIFEQATQHLYMKVKNLGQKNKAQLQFIEIMQPYCGLDNNDERKELHEEIGINLIRQIQKEINEELFKQVSEVNLFVILVFDFVVKILSSKNSENTIYSDVHKIIAGVLDADRLDYCSRDIFCAGVRKDIFPYQRLFSNYKIIKMKNQVDNKSEKKNDEKDISERERIVFCPAIKNIGDVEELIERRWKINTSINFHHRVHKHETIFSEILAQIGYEELHNISDGLEELENGKALPLALSSIWQLVRNLQSNNSLIDYYIIQLDDGWLDTLLKREFFNKYSENYRNEEEHSNDPQWNKFDELISSRKHYYPVYKRSADFHQIDTSLYKAWLKLIESKEKDKENPFIKYITAILRLNETLKMGALNISLIKPLIFDETEAQFFQELEDEMNRFLKTKQGKATNIVDCMIRPCNVSSGFTVGAPVYFWKNNDYVQFEKVSEINRLLQMRKDNCLPFHLYYLPCDNTSEINIKKLETKLLDAIVKKIYQYVEQQKMAQSD